MGFYSLFSDWGLCMTTDRPEVGTSSGNIAGIRGRRKKPRRNERYVEDDQDIFDSFLKSMEFFADSVEWRPRHHPMLDAILDRVQAESGLLYLVDDSDEGLRIAASSGNITDIDLFKLTPNRAFVEESLHDGLSRMYDNCSCELRKPCGKYGVIIRSVMCCPILRRAEKIGVLELINRSSGPFIDEDLAFVEKALRPLAVSLGVAREFENSRKLTITDDLTGLYNSRYLRRYLEIDVKRCLRYKKKVSLLFIDVDGFKRINDTYGHLAGSRILAEIGKVFRQVVRESDVVARYGGDEFVIVLPETPLTGALVTAERIRKKVAEHEFSSSDLQIRLTVSLGVACYPKHALTVEELIRKADAAMYHAKESSRNNIKTAT